MVNNELDPYNLDIIEEANKLRFQNNLLDPYFNLISFLDLHNSDERAVLCPLPDDSPELIACEGSCSPFQKTIYIREADYNRLVDLSKNAKLQLTALDKRLRFTIAHELGHVVLIGNDASYLFFRKEGKELPPYKDPEKQANCFAAALLVPSFYYLPVFCKLSVEEVADMCKASIACTRRQLGLYQMLLEIYPNSPRIRMLLGGDLI